MITRYIIFWDAGLPGTDGRDKIHPCGWCWVAEDLDDDGRPSDNVGSGLLGVSGRPSLRDKRHTDSLVRELRRDVHGSKLPYPPVFSDERWVVRGQYVDRCYECRVES